MGTRSRIAIEKDGKVKSMYCHWDGYLEYNGKMLFDYYNSEEKAEALVNNGFTFEGGKIASVSSADQNTLTLIL